MRFPRCFRTHVRGGEGIVSNVRTAAVVEAAKRSREIENGHVVDRLTVPPGRRLSRRRFLRGASATAGLLALGGLDGVRAARSQSASLPPPETSGIEHIVLVMMENRSFDHFLGWMDGADGRQAGLTYLDAAGAPHGTHRLGSDFQGCGHPDPDHSYEGGRIEYDGGACDGWLRAGDNDDYAIGYYRKKELDFFGSAVTQWTVCDRYFCAMMAPTYPNRFYQHAAQTDRLTSSLDPFPVTLPTIWDRLAAAGLQGRYYYSDVPFLGLWGSTYLPLAGGLDEFVADAAAGALPHVAFVDPRFLDEEAGLSNDDHPHADVRNGEAFLNLVYSAVTTSPAWSRTVLIINYDEWGGFFDHVAPSAAPIPPITRAAGDSDGLRGFRVPNLIVSPFARREFVSSTLFDHTSVLRMIEWRWGLEPLTVRDATANNLAETLDFTTPDFRAKQFNVPTGPFGGACPAVAPPAAPTATDKWRKLHDAAAAHGWRV